MKYFKYIVAVAIIAVVGFYAFALNVMNPEPIAIRLFPSFEWQLSTAVFLLGTFAVGLISGGILLSFSLLSQKLKTGKAKRQLKKTEREVEGLKALPLEEQS